MAKTLSDRDYFCIEGVVPIEGEPGRFHVASDKAREPPYLCDLTENEGNGACSCADYYSRREVAIKEGKPLFTRATSCKHLIRARHVFSIRVLREFAAEIKKSETERVPF